MREGTALVEMSIPRNLQGRDGNPSAVCLTDAHSSPRNQGGCATGATTLIHPQLLHCCHQTGLLLHLCLLTAKARVEKTMPSEIVATMQIPQLLLARVPTENIYILHSLIALFLLPTEGRFGVRLKGMTRSITAKDSLDTSNGGTVPLAPV